MNNRILLATDGSASARAAENLAIDLCNQLGRCTLEVVTVIHPRVEKAAYSRAYPFGAYSSQADVAEAERLLSETGSRVRAQVTNPKAEVFEQLLEHDSPAKAIVDEADATGDCSMIVLGARGLGGFESLALGSVSSQVLHASRCPVVIVKG